MTLLFRRSDKGFNIINKTPYLDTNFEPPIDASVTEVIC